MTYERSRNDAVAIIIIHFVFLLKAIVRTGPETILTFASISRQLSARVCVSEWMSVVNLFLNNQCTFYEYTFDTDFIYSGSRDGVTNFYDSIKIFKCLVWI